MVDVEDNEGDFYIPLSQVRKGWTYIEKSLNDGKAYVDELDKVIRGGKWEIVTLWKTQSAVNTNIIGEKVSEEWIAEGDETMKNYFAKLSFQSGLSNGNNVLVVLKAKDVHNEDALITIANGDILWSWHIWLTNYKPGVNGISENGAVHKYEGVAFTSGKYIAIMDRNLGSTYQGTITRQPQTKEDAVKLYGFQYQWGRKDPFPASGDGTNSKTLPVYGADNSEYTFPTAEVNDNGDNYLLNAVKNPTTFYYKTGGGDWTKQDNTLWTGSASDVFSPAPAGWSLPGAASGYNVNQNAWAGFGDGNFDAADNASPYDSEAGPFDWMAALAGQIGTAGRMYISSDGVSAWYSAAGIRNSVSGALQFTGSYGIYWAGATSGANGCYLNFSSGTVFPSFSGLRSYGYSIRCVHE